MPNEGVRRWGEPVSSQGYPWDKLKRARPLDSATLAAKVDPIVALMNLRRETVRKMNELRHQRDMIEAEIMHAVKERWTTRREMYEMCKAVSKAMKADGDGEDGE